MPPIDLSLENCTLKLSLSCAALTTLARNAKREIIPIATAMSRADTTSRTIKSAPVSAINLITKNDQGSDQAIVGEPFISGTSVRHPGTHGVQASTWVPASAAPYSKRQAKHQIYLRRLIQSI